MNLAERVTQRITPNAAACPKCEAPRVAIEGEAEVEHVEFACGSWQDRYSQPEWADECYRRRGQEGLIELIALRSIPWSQTLGTSAEASFGADLAEAAGWLVESMTSTDT